MPAIIPLPTATAERRYVFGVSIPYLPDLLADRGNYAALGDPIFEAYSRQIALLRALAALPAGRCAMQLRFQATDRASSIAIAIIGVAQQAATASNLLDLLMGARPREVQLDVMTDRDELLAWVDPFPEQAFDVSHFAEIRRAIQPIDPLLSTKEPSMYDQVVLPWGWVRTSLTHSLDILRAQEDAALLAVHVEPRSVNPSLFDYLSDCARHFAKEGQRGRGGELANLGVTLCQQRAGSLRHAALHLRVLLASRTPLLPGIAEYLGADLTRSTDQTGSLPQAFEVVRPRTTPDVDAAGAMIRELSSPVWGLPPAIDPELADLLFLVDPVEANTAFRIPVTPRGGLPGIATAAADVPTGIQMRVREDESSRPQVLLGSGPSVGTFSLSQDDLNEHLLVAGVPGTGKSSTVRSLLLRLPSNVPFLVIDPAKSDYSMLSGIATIYRLGLDRVAFNPLAVPEGASVIGHASRVLAAFDNAFRFSEVFPLARPILGLALRAAYRVRGGIDTAPAQAEWPTIADLYRHTRAVVAEQGFSGDAAANLKGSLLSRMEFLVDGGLGVSLAGSAEDGIRWHELMMVNSVIELRNFSSPEDRSLLFGLLFSGLVGYREGRSESSGLLHVTVLEEAHRLLRASASGSFAAGLFADAIAELRGAGEGFIIVDQAPSTLIPEASKNTGTKVVHRLLDREERDFMGDAMVLNPAQKADLARLRRGRVFVLSGSLADPIVVDTVLEDVPAPDPGRIRPSFVVNGTVQRPWCRHCPAPCTGSTGIAWKSEIEHAANAAAGEPPNVGIVRRLMSSVKETHPQARAIESFCAVAYTLSRVTPDGAVLELLLAEQSRYVVRKRAAPGDADTPVGGG